MIEIHYIVWIRYRGPFGLTIPLPRVRTAHPPRPLGKRPFTIRDALEE